MTTLSRPLPLELHEEIHKCLPLPNAIHILVNISSQAFVDINSDRMRRTIQQLRTSLNEYIDSFIDESLIDEEEYVKNDREELEITNDLEWKPQLDSLLFYGAWMTSIRYFSMSIFMDGKIVGMSENFIEKLLLHMANSRSPQMMLHSVRLQFEELPIPTFLLQLFNEKEQYQIGRRFLFESIQLETDNGQMLHIFNGEFNGNHRLSLFVMNKMDGKNLFEIIIDMDSSNEFIKQLLFWKMEPFDDIANFIKDDGSLGIDDPIKQNGNKLEMKSDIYWNHNLDLFLLHGAGFSQFRHFKINEQYILKNHLPDDLDFVYVDFLISYISNTKHPEDFLESIEMNFNRGRSPLIHKIWKICDKGISEGGKFFKFEGKKFQILSGKTEQLNEWYYKLEFTLPNGPTNGAYLFDVEVQFIREGPNKVVEGIKIQKRKVADNIEMKCDEQIGRGKKRKTINDGEDEDKPTCSSKLLKQ